MKEFKLTVGALMPGWFWMNVKGGFIRPRPGRSGGLNDWGRDGAEVDTPGGVVHASIGDTIINDDGVLSVKHAEPTHVRDVLGES